MNLKALLQQRLTAGFAAAGAEDLPVLLGPATRPEFGDYQANGAMAAAKRLALPPRELAERIIDGANLAGLAEASVTGPGFISLTMAPEALARTLDGRPLQSTLAGERVVVEDRKSVV